MAWCQLQFVMLIVCCTVFIFNDLSADDNLAGPAFYDPSRINEMDASWHERKLQHDARAGDADIVVSMDHSGYWFFKDIIEEYGIDHGVKIAVQEGTCGVSAGLLARKTIDIGGFCCPPGEADRLPGLVYHTLGIASIGILVHKENPLDDVTMHDVRRIFQGKLFYWSELNDGLNRPGPHTPIRVIGRLHCKKRPGHWRLLLGDENLFSPRMYEVPTAKDVIETVSVKPEAIGYELLKNVEHFALHDKVKALKINGFDPSNLQFVTDGRYPLYRVFNITSWSAPDLSNPEVDKLVNFILKRIVSLGPEYGIVAHDKLRAAGWQFSGNELIGVPQ